MSSFLYRFVFAIAAFGWVATAGAAESVKIQKCQDATGKWYYGDEAAAQCAKSKIDVITDKGVKTKVIAAPPTAAELAERERRKDELEREKQAVEEQEKRDKILLQTYAVEDDIILVRDRKLQQLEANIKGSGETMKSLRAQLARQEAQRQQEAEKNDKNLAQTDKNIVQTKSQIERQEASVAAKRQEQERVRQQYDEDLKRYRDLKRRQSSTSTSTSTKKQ